MPEEVRLKGREEEARDGEERRGRGRDGENEEGLMDGEGTEEIGEEGREGVEYEQSGMEGSDRGQLTVLQLDLHYWKEEDIDFCGQDTI